MDWDKVWAKEPVHKKCLIGEAMYIRQEKTTMNRDQGNYQPCNIYNNLIPEGSTSPLDRTAW